MSAKNSRVFKIAGLSFIGFCAVSMAADRAALNPVVSQFAGFCGAFLGALAARRTRAEPGTDEPPISRADSSTAGPSPESDDTGTPQSRSLE